MPKKVLKSLKKNKFVFLFLLIILIGGFFLRTYKPLSLFQYQHDQDLAGWIIKDILVNKHPRLIGQETSSQGVFIGPLFYYLQIPFYLLTGMDPAGSLILVTILGMGAIFSYYWVFSRLFNKKVGLLASGIYAFSYLVVFFDREVVPTMPVMLWSVWSFYSLWILLRGESKAYLLIGFLMGIIWNLNLALLLLTPLILVAQIFSQKWIVSKHLILGVVIFFVTLSPFIAFEARHGFTQTKAISLSLTSDKDYEGGSKPGFAKFDRVMDLVYTNTTRLFLGTNYNNEIVKLTFFALIAALILLIYQKILSRGEVVILVTWPLLYIVFFALNPINVSEYYLNGLNVIWIGIASLAIGELLSRKRFIWVSFILIAIFLFLNFRNFFTHHYSGNGYVEKKAIISFIKEDASARNYPCVAISYITSPGYQSGYRYFLWRQGIKVKSPSSQSPVYTIVFPLSYVNGFDRRFGNIGLVLPDYQRYTKESVESSCEGEDENITQPMTQYTQ